MESSIIVALISAGGTIIVAGIALIGNLIVNSRKKKKEEQDKHDEIINAISSENAKLDLVISGEKHLLLRNLENMTAEFKSYAMDDRKMTDEEYKKFCEQYDCYHALGGNGYATALKSIVDQIYADGKLDA